LHHPRKDEPEFETAEMLYIHPDECIDCGACVPACPVEAIFALDETPDKWSRSSRERRVLSEMSVGAPIAAGDWRPTGGSERRA